MSPGGQKKHNVETRALASLTAFKVGKLGLNNKPDADRINDELLKYNVIVDLEKPLIREKKFREALSALGIDSIYHDSIIKDLKGEKYAFSDEVGVSGQPGRQVTVPAASLPASPLPPISDDLGEETPTPNSPKTHRLTDEQAKALAKAKGKELKSRDWTVPGLFAVAAVLMFVLVVLLIKHPWKKSAVVAQSESAAKATQATPKTETPLQQTQPATSEVSNQIKAQTQQLEALGAKTDAIKNELDEHVASTKPVAKRAQTPKTPTSKQPLRRITTQPYHFFPAPIPMGRKK